MRYKHRCYNYKPFVYDIESYDIGDRLVAECGALWEVREATWFPWEDPDMYTLMMVEKCPDWGKRVGRKG